MPNIQVSEKEWKIAQQIHVEYQQAMSAGQTNIDEFKAKYAGKIHFDDIGNLIVKRVRTSSFLENGELKTFERQGLEDIDHTFLITPGGYITAFGRSIEGAVIGNGAFGTVKSGVLRNNGGHGEPKEVVVKAINTPGELGNEIDALKKLGRLHGSGVAKFDESERPRSIERGYLVDELMTGASLEKLLSPPVSLKSVLERLLKEEKSQGSDQNTDSLTNALQAYTTERGDNPLAWKLEFQEQNIFGKTRKILFDPWPQFLGENARSPKKIEGSDIYNCSQNASAARLFAPFKESVIKMRKQIFTELKDSAPTEIERIALAIESVKALRKFHEAGLLHNDIKGANMIGEIKKGTVLAAQVELIDFGTKLDQDEATTKMMGTPTHMAPEIKYARYSTASDVHSLGKTFELDFALPEKYQYIWRNMTGGEQNELLPEERLSLEEVEVELRAALLDTAITQKISGEYIQNYFPQLKDLKELDRKKVSELISDETITERLEAFTATSTNVEDSEANVDQDEDPDEVFVFEEDKVHENNSVDETDIIYEDSNVEASEANVNQDQEDPDELTIFEEEMDGEKVFIDEVALFEESVAIMSSNFELILPEQVKAKLHEDAKAISGDPILRRKVTSFGYSSNPITPTQKPDLPQPRDCK